MALVISEWLKNCYLYLYLGRKAQIYSEILGSDSFCLSTGKKKMMQMRLSLLQNWVNYWLLLHVVGMLILSLNVQWEECCQWCWCTPKQLIRSHHQSCKKFFFKSQVWITCAQDVIWKHQSYCNHQQSFFLLKVSKQPLAESNLYFCWQNFCQFVLVHRSKDLQIPVQKSPSW